MNDVSGSITKLNKKQKLLVIREGAVTVLPKLFKKWNITHLVFEKDTDAYAKERDATVMEEAKKAGVEVIIKMGRTLWDPDELVKANGGKPTMSITQTQAAGKKVGDIAAPLDVPTTLPNPGDTKLDVEHTQPTHESDLNASIRDGKEKTFSAGISGPKKDFAVPTLKELGLPPATTPILGGETEVMKRLDKILADEEYTATFEKPKTSPAAFDPQATCLTSPYLHFGALSCRYFYHRVEEIVKKRKKAKQSHSDPPTSLTGQLIFRDMYFGAQAAIGWSFGQTYNNPHCRFIPWHLPSKVNVSTKRTTGSYEIDSSEREQWFQRFKHGKTGFPWIDAIMRQLRLEGWIHHLARHAVACFLTRGGCYISWERGADVFEELLIDHETACNAGNWQWLSCTAFFSQFYRCYSPVAFGRKWDENGDFIRHFVPELKGMPKKFIYEPHKAPIADQKKAGVRIYGDGEETEKDGMPVYPKPMFDFATQREICLQGMKAAYAVKMNGDDPRVLDGTWKQAFDDEGEGPTEGSQGGPGGLETWEDADGTEELAHKPPTPKREIKGKGESPKGGRGHKREHSQSTLEGAFRKKAK